VIVGFTLSCATSGRFFFFLSGRPSCIFSTDLTCSLNHLPVLIGYKCICMTSSVMPDTLGYVNVSCMRYIASKKIMIQSSYVIACIRFTIWSHQSTPVNTTTNATMWCRHMSTIKRGLLTLAQSAFFRRNSLCLT